MPATASNVHPIDGGTQLEHAFLHWQCRVRQIAARDGGGRPSEGMMPLVTLAGGRRVGRITTVLCRRPEHSCTMELQHFARHTHDPAQRREAVVRFLAERYFQEHARFADVVTATFPPDSQRAREMVRAARCTLDFAQFGQRFSLDCRAWRLSHNNPLHQATFWHNLCFNPALPSDCIIVGFEPDWARSSGHPTQASRSGRG